MSQDTTKKSGTKRKTTPTKRSVEPLKETTAEHASGALKIFSTKKAEKPQVTEKSQSDQKSAVAKKSVAAPKDTASSEGTTPSKQASSQKSSKDIKSKRTVQVKRIDRTQKPKRDQKSERGQKTERGQKSERTNKSQFSVASLVELKDNALDFARNHTKLVVFLGVVIFLFVGLYPPIRGYYHAVREHDELLLNQQKLEEDQNDLSPRFRVCRQKRAS